jgi:hypothetical protein
MIAFGGLLPFMIQALSLVVRPGVVAAGIILIVLGLVSLTACLALSRLMPVTNTKRETMGGALPAARKVEPCHV